MVRYLRLAGDIGVTANPSIQTLLTITEALDVVRVGNRENLLPGRSLFCQVIDHLLGLAYGFKRKSLTVALSRRA